MVSLEMGAVDLRDSEDQLASRDCPEAICGLDRAERDSNDDHSLAAVQSALELVAQSFRAELCSFFWQQRPGGALHCLNGGSVHPSSAEQVEWLKRTDDGGVCQLPGSLDGRGPLLVPVGGPDRAFSGALAVRFDDGVEPSQARRLMVAAARHLELLLVSSRAYTVRASGYEALVEIGAQIQAEEINADAILTFIVERARGLLDTDLAWLSLIDEQQPNTLRVNVAVGAAAPAFLEMELELPTGIGGTALQERRPVAVRDAPSYGHDMPGGVVHGLAEEGVNAVLCAPLMRGEEMIGALYVGSRAPSEFGDEECSLLAALAAQVSVAIENARLYQTLRSKNQMLQETFDVHRKLTDASLAKVGRDRIAHELACLLDRDVVLTLTDAVPHFSLYSREPAAETPVCIEGDEVDVCHDEAIVDVVAGETSFGSLQALGAEPLSVLQRKALEHGATVLALELTRERAELEVEWRLQGELLEELLRSGSEMSSGLIARAERFGIDLAKPHRIAVLSPIGQVSSGALLDFVRRSRRVRGLRDGLAAQRGEVTLVAIADDDEKPGKDLLNDIQRAARRAGMPFTCGLSGPRRKFAVAQREAEAALNLAGQTNDPESMVSYEDLGPLRFMLDSPNVDEMSMMVTDLLGGLAEHDVNRNSQLLLTLRAFLGSGGHRRETAERCHIHVSTLKYRLARIADILGCSLNDPTARFELKLAFEVLDILEALDESPLATNQIEPDA